MFFSSGVKITSFCIWMDTVRGIFCFPRNSSSADSKYNHIKNRKESVVKELKSVVKNFLRHLNGSTQIRHWNRNQENQRGFVCKRCTCQRFFFPQGIIISGRLTLNYPPKHR